MKKSLIIGMTVFVLIMSCGQDTSKLEKGTPEYEFALKVSEKLPYFNPDENNILVKTRYFDLKTGELLSNIYQTAGKRTSQFASMDTSMLRQIMVNNAKQLAEKKLLLKAAKDQNITVSEEKVDSFLNIQYTRHGSQEKFVQNIEAMGLSLENVRQQMKESLMIETYLDNFFNEQLDITDEKLMDAYQQDKTATVRHILLSTQGKSEEEKQQIHKKMEEILEKARAGEDFAELAKKYTEDPGSKETGGLYENFQRGVMVKPFEEAAFSVPVGEISDIIETDYGYHIIKVIDRKKEERPFADVKTELRNQLDQNNRKELYFQHLDSLREQADYELVDF